jgi:hypothetical protein
VLMIEKKMAAMAAVMGLCALLPAGAEGDRVSGSVTCYVAMEEGASAEYNSMYIKNMGLQPELAALVAPVHFEKGKNGFAMKTEADFSYEADQPQRLLRSGRAALYEVDASYTAAALPKAAKKVDVSFTFASLVQKNGIYPVSQKAISLAAAKAGYASGRAWILKLKVDKKGKFSASVALAP